MGDALRKDLKSNGWTSRLGGPIAPPRSRRSLSRVSFPATTLDADELERRIRAIMRDIDTLMADVRAHVGSGKAPYTDMLMDRTSAGDDPYGLYVAKDALGTIVYSHNEAHAEGLDEQAAEDVAAETRERLRFALLPPAEQRQHYEEAEARRRAYWAARDN